MLILIYVLIDPITKEFRYVGQTRRGLARAYEHFHASRLETDDTHCGRWIKQLIRKGYLPEVGILEVLTDTTLLDAMEDEWIERGFAKGWPLTNLRKGGQGAIDTFIAEKLINTKSQIKPRRPKDSIETRRRKSAAAKARIVPTLGDLNKWARNFDACVSCGKTDAYHKGNGLCYRCHCKEERIHKNILTVENAGASNNVVFDHPQPHPPSSTETTSPFPNAPGKPWSLLHTKCVECGLTSHKHKGHGRCSKCHEQARQIRRRDANRIKKGIRPWTVGSSVRRLRYLQ
jgi:Zn finger protein HypA/HybF involved in hydrogenase expression